MNKEEILMRVQKNKDKMDEMELQIEANAGRWAFSVSTIVCIAFMFFNMTQGQLYTDLYAIYCSMMVAFYGYKWYRLRKGNDLVVALMFSAATLLLTAAYILHVLQ